MTDLFQYDGDHYIQSSDIKQLIDDAEGERADLVTDAEDAEHPMEKSDLWREVALWDEANAEKLAALKKECSDLPDDETCVHEDKMDEYLQEFVNDCYDLRRVERDLPNFITLNVDYDALKQDYTTFELDGSTYYVRST